MSDLETLAKQIAEYLKASQPVAPVASQPMQPVGQPLPQFGQAFMPTGSPQIQAVSVPISVALPDGREVTVRLHFGPEWAQNLQQLVIYCTNVYGQSLSARSPWRGYYGSSYNGEYRRRR